MIQDEVKTIQRCVKRLNEVETHQVRLNGLSLRNYQTIQECERLSKEKEQLLISLEDAWYGSSPERYKREF